jgi:inosine-uridine nucleoside N-ribohydrolase
MKLKFVLFLLVSISLQNLNAQNKNKPQPIIFDSDMGPDYDDVGAITLLHAFADSGYIKILGTIASTKYEGVASVFNVFNTYFNRPDMAIGVPKKNALMLRDSQHWTDTLIAKYPHAIQSNDDVPDATTLYRKLLASQPNKSVTIVTVGFLTNLANLLQSAPDEYSKLTGQQLVTKKVKQLVCMAGRFPSGKEFNVERDALASQYAFSNWPTPVILSGFEIGQKIKTGLPLIHNNSIHNSPVKDVFAISIPKSAQDSTGRMSWDETAVLVAVKGYKQWYTVQKGKITVANDGSNGWENQGKLQSYLIEKEHPEKVRDFINHVIMHQPVKK